jgi:hypothetical protein
MKVVVFRYMQILLPFQPSVTMNTAPPERVVPSRRTGDFQKSPAVPEET